MTEPATPDDTAVLAAGDDVATHDEEPNPEDHAGDVVGEDPAIVAELAALEADDEDGAA